MARRADPSIELSEVASTLDAFGPVTDLWLAFNRGDFLVEPGLSPALFALGGSVSLPAALLKNARDEWLAVTDCLCGYGGSGPHNTLGLLRELGLDTDALAQTIFSHRFLHLEVSVGRIVQQSANPITHLGERPRVVGETVIASLQTSPLSLSRSWLSWDPYRHSVESFERERNGDGNTLQDWFDELLSRKPAPSWTRGTLRARIYTSLQAARDAGLERHHPLGHELPTLILETGDLQLWCDAGQHHGRRLMSDDAVEALRIVGLDSPRNSQLMRRPLFLEVGGPLVREPSELAAALSETL